MCTVLEHLQSWGLRLALCTNRTDSVHRVLEHFELTRFFSPVMTVSRAAPKPDPGGLLCILDEWKMKAGDVAYIGDSPVDEQAARRARIPFWSFGNQELYAELYLSGFEELFSLLSPLLDAPRE
jgi:phosphoglycolate phosphatase-like HAD superfamily hydrolase